jgi:hypothetical protein
LSSSNIPKTEVRKPKDFKPKIPISKVLTHPVIQLGKNVLSPTQLASPAETFYDWSKHDQIIGQQIADRGNVMSELGVSPQPLATYEVDLPTLPADDANFIRPEVPTINWFDKPEYGPYISHSPKINTIEYVVPDYDVAPPYPMELPDEESFFDPVPAQDIPSLLDVFDVEPIPSIDIEPPEPIKKMERRKPDQIHEKGIAIEIVEVPNKLPIVKFRPTLVKGSTPRS